MNTFSQIVTLGSFVYLVTAGLSQAGTIVWGGGIGTMNYSSDGTALEAGSSNAVAFQVGVFQDPTTGAEFVPELSNADSWKDNWVPFGATSTVTNRSEADYQNPSLTRGATLTENYVRGLVSYGNQPGQTLTYSSATNPDFDVHPTVGYRVYIWGYDNDQSYNPANTSARPQWLLFTGTDDSGANKNWVVPDSSENDNGTFAMTWDANSANEAVVGRIAGATDGAGTITNGTPSLAGADFQFATIPEPSSLLVLLVAMTSGVLRRHR